MWNLRVPMGPVVYSRRLGGRPASGMSLGKGLALLIASPFLLIAVLAVIWLLWQVRWLVLVLLVLGVVAYLVRSYRARG